MEVRVAGRRCGPAPRKAARRSLGPAGGKGAVQPALAKRPASRSLLLGPDPRPRPPQPPALSLPGRATEGPPWEDHGARFLLLPPAPRAEAVARETKLAVWRGVRRFSATGTSSPIRPPQPRHPRETGEAGAQREAPNPPAGQGHDTRGTKTPGTTAAAAATTTGNASPEERPLVGSCHSPGYGTSLLAIDLSLPPRQPAIPLNCGTEVRLPRSDNAFGSRAQWCPRSSVPLEK